MKNSIPVYDICAISESADRDVLISRFGDYSRHNKHLHLPHKHNFYHMVFFTKGSGNHTIDFNTFDVTPYQIYFMIPGQVHSWDFDGEIDGYIVNFSSQYYQSFLLKSDYLETFTFFSGEISDAAISLPLPLQQKVIALFEDILEAYNDDSVSRFKQDYIKLLILQVFILIETSNHQNIHQTYNNYNFTILKNFKKLLEQNYDKLRLPKDYAALLYITPNHLNALCNDILGISAGEFIRKRVLLEAKRLLVNLDISITEIAYRLNFSDNSYFTKFFKKMEGITPEEFRKKSLK
ncbi:AraC family transcriptional regulator [Pseudoxanthomonas sp. SGD-10]|nr:AraC family transcriptional regulator [Pseudoxanthomonas sp. SGD-10]